MPSSIAATVIYKRPASPAISVSSCVEASDLPSSVYCSGHPLLQHKMTLLRDRKTTTRDFRHLMRELTLYLGYEATTEITLKPRVVEGTLGPVAGQKLSDKIAIVPILRGGLGMVDAMTEILPNAAVYHIGMFSNHKSSSLPIQYYNRLPKEKDKVADLTFVLDPLIATAGTCSATVSTLKKWGAKKIVVIGVVGSLQGLHKLTQAHPDIRVHVASIDEAISEDGHILPGIGDASERLFTAYGVGEHDDETSVHTVASAKKRKAGEKNGC
ncbi:uracil phosphoribosyltransferase [Nannochloropsis oceanica]